MSRVFPDGAPVLIVGGGPVGMAVAAELGRYNVECLLVEATDGSAMPQRRQNSMVRELSALARG